MLQLVGFFVALFAGGVALGTVIGSVLGATLGRVLHRFEGNWWWLGPCLALATAAVTGRLLGLY